jgi:phosphatidylinositol glycan class A protein
MANVGPNESSRKQTRENSVSCSSYLDSSSIATAKQLRSSPASSELSSSISSIGQLRIAFVSDFCYPCLGGVEFHQYFLAQCLRRLGHHVILITGTYGNRRGVRYLSEGLKAYYLPILVSKQHVGFPTFFANFPILRSIWITERIQIVHGHQSTASLAHEALFHARTMGLTTIYTDHSLFTLHSFESLHLNELMAFTLCECARIITVSHTSKENICVRCKSTVQPSRVAVIPNAVNSSDFCPPSISESSSRDPRVITIIVLSRLVYRKGVDLLVDIIPLICKRYPNVRFIIGGDGM